MYYQDEKRINIVADYNDVKDTPQYTAQNILSAWDELQERNRKRRKIPFVLNELAALSNPRFRNSASYRNNLSYINSLGAEDATQFNAQMKMLQEQEMNQLRGLMTGRLMDANPRTVGEFDEWVSSQPSWVRENYDTYYGMWEKRADQQFQEDKIDRELGDAATQKKLDEREQLVISEALRQINDIPIEQQDFVTIQKIRNEMIQMGRRIGFGADRLKNIADSYDAYFITAPSSKIVFDQEAPPGTNPVVYRTDRQIAMEPNRYTKVQDEKNNLTPSFQAALTATIGDPELNMTQEDMAYLRKMNEEGVVNVMEMLFKVNRPQFERMSEIFRKAKEKEGLLSMLFGTGGMGGENSDISIKSVKRN